MSRTQKILLIIPASFLMLLAAVTVIIACVGSPQPPVCPTSIFLGKFMTETLVSGVEGTAPTGLFPFVTWFVEEEAGETQDCPVPNGASATVTYVCTPSDGGAAFVIGPQMFTLDIPTTPGPQPPSGAGVFVPFAIPAGTPPSACVIEGTYDVTFALPTGGLGFLSDTGDANAYFVPPSPDDPSLPIVSMKVLAQGEDETGAFAAHQGDQKLFYVLLENNDLTRSATFNIEGLMIQAAGFADGYTDDEAAYNAGNYRVANENDQFSTELFTDETPGPLANTPDGSKNGSGPQVETEVTLEPGEVALLGVAQRIFGACADGSCDENQFTAEVTMTVPGTGKVMDDVYHVGASFINNTNNSRPPTYPGLTVADALKMNPTFDAFWSWVEILDGSGTVIDEMHGTNLLLAERPQTALGIRISGETIRDQNNSPWPTHWHDQITVENPVDGARWEAFGGYQDDDFALRRALTSVTGLNPAQGDCPIPLITMNEANSAILVDLDVSGGCNDDALVSINGAPMGTVGDLRNNDGYRVDDASCRTLSFPWGDNLSDAPVLVADPPFMHFNLEDKEAFVTPINITDLEGNGQPWELTVEGPGADAVSVLTPIGDAGTQALVEVDPTGLTALTTLETTLVFTNPGAINSPLRVPLVVRCQPQQLLVPDLAIDGPPLFPTDDPIEFPSSLNPDPTEFSFDNPTFLFEINQPTVDITIEPVNDPPINSIPGTDPLFNDEVQLVFGNDALNACSDPNTSCQYVEFGGPFMQLNFVIALQGLFPSRDGGVADVTVHSTASNATTTTVTKPFGVLGDDNVVRVTDSDALGEAIRLFKDAATLEGTTFDDATIALDAVRFGMPNGVPASTNGSFYLDDFQAFRTLGGKTAQPRVTVDFDGCVPDPTNNLFCGFVFRAPGGGVRNLRIENAPGAAIEAAADSIGVLNSELAGNAVGVLVSSGDGVLIRGTTFIDNDLGLDLGGDGITANDDGDGDTGPNQLQNYPVLNRALIGSSSTIEGTLNSVPNRTYTLEFFASTSDACQQGNRNGEMLLGMTSVTTDASGNAAFSAVLDSTVVRLDFVTATATEDENQRTSELSACVQVVTGVAAEERPGVPVRYTLSQNYPNPFNPSTHIRYAVPHNSPVRLEVFDVLGRLVAVLVDEMKPAGSYEVVFDARGLPSGTYLYTMTGDGFKQSRPLMLVK